jgi:hypothetical protein
VFQLEQLHSAVQQLVSLLSSDQIAYILKGNKETESADTPPCFGAGLKFRIEPGPPVPTEAELAYLARPASPARHAAQLTFSLEAVQAAAAAAKRPAEGIGVNWLEKLIVTFYGDEKPLGKTMLRKFAL